MLFPITKVVLALRTKIRYMIVYNLNGLPNGIFYANHNFAITVFPHTVSSLEYFPPLNSFCTLVRKPFKFSLHNRKTNAGFFTVLQFQKRIYSCRGRQLYEEIRLVFLFLTADQNNIWSKICKCHLSFVQKYRNIWNSNHKLSTNRPFSK